jgi:arabinose-5-phosphate isomerase
MKPMERRSRSEPSGLAVESPARRTARTVLEIEARAVHALAGRLDATFDRAVELLVDSPGRVIVTGMGKSGIICQKIAATLSSTGRPAAFLHPAEALHGDLGMIAAGDVILAVSHSGETAEVVRLLELVRRLGSRIITLTGRADSTLARHADVTLDVGVDKEACSLDLLPTASTTAALAMGDALAVACYERRGFTAEEFARFHPGGRLGREVTLVRALMHAGADLPRVAERASLREAVEEMSAKRLGMTCIVDDGGRLVGILTDGDLRRRMLRAARPLDGPVAEAMVASPQTIAPDALASEALRSMEARKITSLPVVEQGSLLVGVIQIHDLWRTELF